MDTPTLSQQAMRARALARHDGFLEAVENGRSSGDVLGLLKVRVHEARKSPAPRGSTAVRFSLPAVRRGRLVKDGERSMHMQFTDSVNRTAAEIDRYATEAREARAATVDNGVTLEDEEPSTAAHLDAYATRDRTAAGDRPDEQVTTNMAGGSHQRGAVWTQIERHEDTLHRQGLDRINVSRENMPEFWTHVRNNPACPADFRDFMLCIGNHAAAGKKLDKQRAKIGSPYITNQARDVHRWLSNEFDNFAPDHVGKRPFTFSTSRRARYERHGDLELPHELDEAAHRRIAARLKARIEGYATPAERRFGLGDGTEVDGYLPVVIAYHPPEAANNERNWHLHFLFHDRAIAIDADGKVHFAAVKARELTAFGMMKRVRKDAAVIINEELAASAATIRVTTAKSTDVPQVKLGKGLQRLENGGEVTEKGLYNRVVSWNRPHRKNIEYVAERRHDMAIDDDRLWRRIASATRISSADRQQFDDERRKILRLQEDALEAEATARYAEYVIEMAESSLKARGETASRREAAATTDLERAKWTGEVLDVAASQADLHDELGPERATRDHARGTAAAATAEWQLRRVALIDTFDNMVALANARLVARLNASMTAVQTSLQRAPELNRLVDNIHSTPLVVTQTEGIWGVAIADDPDRIVAGVDLTAPRIQARLQGIAEQQAEEQAMVEAWLAKHGPAAVQQASLAGATSYVQRQVARWQDKVVTRELVQRRQSGPTPAALDAVPIGAVTKVSSRHVTEERIELVNAIIDKRRGSLDPQEIAKLAAITSRDSEKHDTAHLHKSVKTAMGFVVTPGGARQPGRKVRADGSPVRAGQLRADRRAVSSVSTPNAAVVIERAEAPIAQKAAAPSGVAQPQTATTPFRRHGAPGLDNATPRARSGAPAMPRHFVDPAAAAAVARLFYDADWSPADHWENPARIPEQAPHQARSATASLPSSPVTETTAEPDHRTAANQARAALAQSQSR